MTEIITKGVLALAGTQHKKPLTPAVRFEDLTENVATIVRLVGEDFDVTHTQLLAEGRGTQYVAKARQVVMWACSSLLEMNMVQIGETLGRDRTSVRHGVEYVEGKVQADDNVRDYLSTLNHRYLEIGAHEASGAEGEDMI